MNILLPIETKSLLIRHFTQEDISKIFTLSQEPCLRTWIPDQVYESEQAASDALKYLIQQYDSAPDPSKSPYVLGVCLKATLELIGHVGLSPARSQVEIGYAIETKYQGRGFGTEAVSTLSDFGIFVLDLPLIYGIVAADNIGSCRVLEKSGFILLDEASASLHGTKRLVRVYRRLGRDKLNTF